MFAHSARLWFAAASCVLGCSTLAAAQSGMTHLSLSSAIALAVNPRQTAIAQAQENVEKADLNVRRDRAATAFEMHGEIVIREVRIDLRALGLTIPVYPLTDPPTFVGANGPFGVLDPRLKAAKILIDRAAARNVKAAQSTVAEARAQEAEEKEQIAEEVARDYLAALRAGEVARLRQEQLTTAQRGLDLAQAERQQGAAGAADVRTARMSVTGAEQQLSAARLDESKSVLRLQYLLGGAWGETLALDPIAPVADQSTLDAANAAAKVGNPRLTAISLHRTTLDLRRSAVSAERLPTLSGNADFGGNVVVPDPSGAGGPARSITYNAALSLQVPILDGHRRELETSDVIAEQHLVNAQQRDLEREIEIEMETRVAFASLQSAEEQLKLARADLSDADDALREQQADRDAGNLNAVEFQRAGLQHDAVEDEVNAAIVAQQNARVDLAAAMGNVATTKW